MLDAEGCELLEAAAEMPGLGPLLTHSQRPSIRPAHQLYQQPNFQLPTRPSTKNGAEALLLAKDDEYNRDSIWSNASGSPIPLREYNSSIRPSQHQRAYSQSTIDGHSVQDWDVGAFRVVIDRPGTESRPKTSSGNHSSFPTLEVPIPSYKIGTPRFSVRGTPFIRGSSYAPTEIDNENSMMSQSQRIPSFIGRNRDSLSFHPAKPFPRHSIASSYQQDSASVYELRLPPTGLSGKTPNLMPREAITPEMFEIISTYPMSEDKSVVRRNLAGQISAATPARLIVEVTQELNYELVASMFITYRSYYAASDLLSLVMARLQHGINQGDKGLVVTVRCFTVIRHWLVNFFIDDFVLDYNLRVQFCDLVNHMVEKHRVMMTNSKTTNDILSNIKRLWRDSCATYWDGPEFDVESGPLVPIFPGGVAGSRDPKLTPDDLAEMIKPQDPRSDEMSILSGPPVLDLDLENTADTSQRFFSSHPLQQSTVQETTRDESTATVRRHRPRKSISERPMSPASRASVEVFSCSFPLRGQPLSSSNGDGAHPVPASSISASSPVIRASTSKPMRANSQRGPRRNRSVSNSSRPERPWSADGDQSVAEERELYFTDRFAGSLIRGLIFLPPADTYLPAEEVSVSRPASLPTRSEISAKHETTDSKGGMKKMFGTVRRAVNKSEGGEKSQQSKYPHLSIALEQTAAIGCAAGAAVVKQCFGGSAKNTTMRPDKLSQYVEREFEAAVEYHRAQFAEAEERANDEARPQTERRLHDTEMLSEQSRSQAVPNRVPLSNIQGLPTQFESFPQFEPTRTETEKPMSIPSIIQTLPATTYTDTGRQDSTAPTPPVTPPDKFQNNAQHLGEYGTSIERTPSLVLGLRSPASDLDSQPSFKKLKHPSSRMQRKERRSSHSTSLRRIASFNSGYTRQITERSFDATTFSDNPGRSSMGSTHAPGNRVLRRRPGGDLRAVKRVNDLPLRRYRSTSSLSTYDASLRGSFKLGSVESTSYLNVQHAAQEESRSFSTGALADPVGTTKPISLYSTDSKPVMRPSFQAEAAKLADIPDDADDDGGVESALLKLEGKFEKRRSQTTATPVSSEEFTADSEKEFEQMFERTASDDSTQTEKALARDSIAPKASSHNDLTPTDSKVYVEDTTPRPEQKASLSGSERSYNSIPLLQRDSEYIPYRPKPAAPSLQPNQSEYSFASQDSLDIINKTDSMNSIAPGETLPRHFEAKPESYIEIEHSDVSSEMSLPSQDFSNSAFLDKNKQNTRGKTLTELHLPLSQKVPDLSMTMQQALGLLQSRDTYPTTPEGTPTIPPPLARPTQRSWDNGYLPEPAERLSMNEPIQVHADGPQVNDEHLPFILSFPSSLLAQQFTLIEMEALSEIHFRELLEMKWTHDAAASIRSWPKFLQKLSTIEDDDSVSHGIEICAARSSIMTSWAISQVVLTSKLEERAMAVVKLIHIANECRKLGNYATLFQLTVALSNPVLSDLRETWARVPATDITMLRDLETLIQPANNFRRLRDEMENVLGKRACIPLVAIYAKDLSALKDMPSYIASSRTEPPLINVTKCKAQAAVVQLVARYLERTGELGQGRERIRPVEGVVERCLWVGGLRDGEVKEFARNLV